MSWSSTIRAWTARAREVADRLLEEIRRSDRFFKMRAGVVAAWAAIALITIVFACPSSGPGNSLGADVRVERDAFIGSTQVLVRNDSDDVWTDIVLTLDDAWTHREPTLRPNDQLVVSAGQFRRGPEALPAGHRPRRLEVSCKQGRHAMDLR